MKNTYENLNEYKNRLSSISAVVEFAFGLGSPCKSVLAELLIVSGLLAEPAVLSLVVVELVPLLGCCSFVDVDVWKSTLGGAQRRAIVVHHGCSLG